MKLFLQIILGIVTIAIIAMFTKPSDEECKSEVSNVVKEFLKGKVQSDLAFVNRMIDKVSEENVRVEDKLFYKEVNFEFKGETKTVAYGFFTYVKITEL